MTQCRVIGIEGPNGEPLNYILFSVYREDIRKLEQENKKLKNSIEYRKKKADKNQEKANEIDKIMKLPGVMVDGKIDWSKVAVYYMM